MKNAMAKEKTETAMTEGTATVKAKEAIASYCDTLGLSLHSQCDFEAAFLGRYSLVACPQGSG